MRGSLRRAAVWLMGLAALLAFWLGPAPRAAAADTFDRFDVSYVVTEDGVLEVSETVVLRFGASSERHGYERFLVTREPYDNDRDMTYAISNIQVTSPDAISTEVQTSEYATTARDHALRIRIGSADRTISSATATYVISYDVRGALRTPGDYSELYWDVTGSSLGAVQAASVTVDVPGGVQEVNCYVGTPRSTVGCTDATIAGGGQAVFTQDGISSGELLTIGVKIAAGAVTGAEPILSERGDAAAGRQTLFAQIGGGAAVVGIPVLGWLYYRRRGRDERFADLPPGTVPLPGSPSHVVPNDPDIQIPVSFVPPRLPLSYAGLLLDGKSRTEHVTATLIGLATSGTIQLNVAGDTSAVIRDASRVPDPPSEILLSALFPAGPDTVHIGSAGQLAGASDRLAADARAVALGNGWFRQLRTGRTFGSSIGLVWVVFLFVGFFNPAALGALGWFVIPATLALVITLIVVRVKMSRGQRTAVGRAWTDQVEGFRTYLATAEADQLRFEEGVDIFSRYLPWAILFGLADRWVAVCERAVALGRLQQPDTTWYGGTAWDGHLILWNLNTLSSSVGAAAAPLPTSGPSFSSDTGFGGGGSSFGGGGGFAGGGGGGGGGGSW